MLLLSSVLIDNESRKELNPAPERGQVIRRSIQSPLFSVIKASKIKHAWKRGRLFLLITSSPVVISISQWVLSLANLLTSLFQSSFYKVSNKFSPFSPSLPFPFPSVNDWICLCKCFPSCLNQQPVFQN